jgi:kynureninase
LTGSSLPAVDAAEAQRLDSGDELAAFADEFHQPAAPGGGPAIYLCGHSLGLQPKTAADFVEQELADWRRLAVLGHGQARRPWISYHETLSAPLGELVGASPDEVVAMNSLTVNLHLMMVGFFRPQGERRAILIEKAAFPSDRYAICSQLAFHGLDADRDLIEVEPRPGERNLRTGDLVELIERQAQRLCLVLLPGVQYLTGQSLTLAPIIAAARRAGAAVGLDLAHAIGNTPLRLHDWNADFAVWCSYKYLNAGPGAIGGCFVHERHANRLDLPRFAGWWGHDKLRRFEMGPEFRPIPGAEGWQVSNPPILSTAPLLASLELFRRAGGARLRRKSLALTGFLRRAIESLAPDRVEIITPADPRSHGCQLSLRLIQEPAAARRSFEALGREGVIGDWREPDVLRLSPTPLYNSFADAWTAAAALARVMQA